MGSHPVQPVCVRRTGRRTANARQQFSGAARSAFPPLRPDPNRSSRHHQCSIPTSIRNKNTRGTFSSDSWKSSSPPWLMPSAIRPFLPDAYRRCGHQDGGLAIQPAGLNHDWSSLDLLRPSSEPLPMISYLPVFPARELPDCPSLRASNEHSFIVRVLLNTLRDGG